MSQESTMICLDNSEWMRNGDMQPNRLQCQQEAIRVLIQYKLRSNPENAVGMLSMAKATQVLASMTSEDRKVLSRLHQVQINGASQVVNGIKTAHLVLKNRPNRNHKTRIVVFVGSPLDELEKECAEGEFLRLAKKLKKENVKVDFVLFGEATAENNQPIVDFVDVLNGKEGTGSNVVVVPGDAKLFEALLSSPICRNEDGSQGPAGGGGFDFGFDADDDPELALALRVSLEEQRQRQQQEAAAQQAGGEAGANQGPEGANPAAMDVDHPAAAGQQAPLHHEPSAESSLAAPLPLQLDEGNLGGHRGGMNPEAMTEEEQIQWALRMSMMEDHAAEGGGAGSAGGAGSTGPTGAGHRAGAAAAPGGGTLLKPVPIYSHPVVGGIPPGAAGPPSSHDEDVLSSAGATASGTPAPTPMEAEMGEMGEGADQQQQHSVALGQLMDNPELLRQLVDQMPGGASASGGGAGKGDGGEEEGDEESESGKSKPKKAKKESK